MFRNVYVGQAVARQNGDGIWLRIKEHLTQKYWTDALACVSADNSWGPTELSYLENYFASLIVSAKQHSGTYRVENGNIPNPGRVTKEKEWELGHFINEIRTILESLRYDFFKEEKSEQPLFDLSKVGETPPEPQHNIRKNGLPIKVIKQKASPSTFSVSFPDGMIVQGDSAAETMALTINRIGPKRVAELHLRAGGGHLVSQEGSTTYQGANYPLEDGFVLCTHSSTDDKIKKLEKISKLLNLGLVINKTQKT